MILDILDYAEQMLPLGAAALAVFLLLRPARKRRLSRLDLLSSGRREWALALFLVFCAGLAALTLFPANLWAYVFDWLFRRDYWKWAWGANGWRLADFYPSWEETASQFAHLPNMLKPFEEISRALNRRSYWLLFMLLGNIIMFMPLGFFPALLWRRWRWWKSLLHHDGPVFYWPQHRHRRRDPEHYWGHDRLLGLLPAAGGFAKLHQKISMSA